MAAIDTTVTVTTTHTLQLGDRASLALELVERDGAPGVHLHARANHSYGWAALTLTPAEAREFGALLIAAANQVGR